MPSSSQGLAQAREKYRGLSVRWGFYWAMWCAVLWGLWYIPGGAIWAEAPFATMNLDRQSEFLLAAAVITAFNSVGVLLFLFLWTGVLEKWREYLRTIRQFRTISKWYFLAAIFGGPCALFGSYLAIGYVGPIFAAVSALLYPIVGASLARIWYHENITPRAGLGILIIVAGGIAIFAPGIFQELSGSGTGAWLGYLGGAMAAIGWGVEGAVAGRVLDVSDPDVGITIRFTAEIFFWLFLILPAIAIFGEVPVMPVVVETFSLWPLVWLGLAGLSFGYCYVSWYKSFPLIGVGRGQAIAAFYGVFAVVFLAVFTLSFPDWNFLLGLALTVSGGFVIFTEKKSEVEVVRKLDDRPLTALPEPSRRFHGKPHMKGFILSCLKRAPQGLWDHEIANQAMQAYGHAGDYWKGEVRVTLTDLYSGALIEELEDDLDDGRYFGPGKVLVKFRLTPLGHRRLAETGLA